MNKEELSKYGWEDSTKELISMIGFDNTISLKNNKCVIVRRVNRDQHLLKILFYKIDHQDAFVFNAKMSYNDNTEKWDVWDGRDDGVFNTFEDSLEMLKKAHEKREEIGFNKLYF